MLRQLGDGATDTVLIEIVFNESIIASIIAELSQHWRWHCCKQILMDNDQAR